MAGTNRFGGMVVIAALLSTAALAQDGETPPAAEEKPALDVTLLPFTADSIKMVMEHNAPKIQDCYEDTLANRRKPVQGRISTSFKITPEGLVKSAKVERQGSTVWDAKLNDCVVAVLTSISFPKPKDNRDYPIQYPFNLKAVR
jgi:hypothetical protein